MGSLSVPGIGSVIAICNFVIISHAGSCGDSDNDCKSFLILSGGGSRQGSVQGLGFGRHSQTANVHDWMLPKTFSSKDDDGISDGSIF